MRKKITFVTIYMILCIICLVILFNIFLEESSSEEVKNKSSTDLLDRLFEKVRIINDLKIENSLKLDNYNKASDKELRNRLYWLMFYAKNRKVYGDADFKVKNSEYDWKRLWKDSVAIIWEESWFVNYSSQDLGTGFGWGALQWEHCKTLANVYKFDYSKDKKELLDSDRLQAKYIIGNLLMLYNHYEGNRGQAITGYNRGFNVGDDYMYVDYYNNVSGRINTIDKWLLEEGEVNE